MDRDTNNASKEPYKTMQNPSSHHHFGKSTMQSMASSSAGPSASTSAADRATTSNINSKLYNNSNVAASNSSNASTSTTSSTKAIPTNLAAKQRYIESYDFPNCDESSKYEKVAKIGQGTFGEVFKARERGNKKFVAMKKVLMDNEKEGVSN